MADPDEGRENPDQRGSIFHKAQRGGQQDASYNKGAGVLDLPGDLAASGRASVTAGDRGRSHGRSGRYSGSSRDHCEAVDSSRIVTRDMPLRHFGRITEARGMETHIELVQVGVSGEGPTIKG